jgi:hypothetical protein
MKITVEYNPLAGHVIKDGEAEEWVDEIIKTAFSIKDEKDLVITVASSLLVDFFRLRLVQGVIKVDQIEFTFDGKVIKHNSYATFEHWPKGYCDVGDHVLEGLLTWQSTTAKKRRKEREERKKKKLEALQKPNGV